MAITVDRLLTELDEQGDALAAAVADHDRRVPGLDWTVRDVVVHTGAVHRWARDIVGHRRAANDTGGSRAFHPDPPVADADLAAWLREGHRALVTELTGAPHDLEVWTFARGLSARHFWIRRQAHETAIHRADVDVARGIEPEFTADLAQDGIEELAAGFARNRAFATTERGVLTLDVSDGPSWSIRFGGERITAECTGEPDPDHDARVAGTSSQLYRWLWNRPVDIATEGDPAVLALWRRVRI